MEFSRCTRCGKKLTSPESVKRGYGPTCAAKVRQAHAVASSEFKPHQVASAVELIEDGGVVATRCPTVFLTVSCNGLRVHRTDARGFCTCEAGIRQARCYHVAAVRMLLAA